jgi:hypothetical protein
MRPVFASLARIVAFVVALGAPTPVARAQYAEPADGGPVPSRSTGTSDSSSGAGSSSSTSSSAGSSSGSRSSGGAGASGASGAPTTTHHVSQAGGSTAAITRSGSPEHSPATAQPVRSEVERETPVHEEDDGRRADFLWIEIEGGVSYVNLVAFQQTNFSPPGFTEVEGIGPMVGVGLGFRVFFLALGARATLASYPGFEIGTVGGEVQFRLPTPVVEPWIRVGAGYAWQGSANYTDPTASGSTGSNVYGWTLNAALGLDVFIAWWFTLGIGVTLDFLNMTRQTDVTAPCMGVTEFCPTQSGDAIGAQARGFLQAGFHF